MAFPVALKLSPSSPWLPRPLLTQKLLKMSVGNSGEGLQSVTQSIHLRKEVQEFVLLATMVVGVSELGLS